MADKKQTERFVKKARELEADESDEAFERAFKKVVPPKRTTTSPRNDDHGDG